MSDLDLEITPEEQEAQETVHEAYYDLVELDEKRRYLCLDMARMCNTMPQDLVKIARAMEAFLMGKGVRGAVE